MANDVVSASYSKEDYIKDLVGFESSACPIGLLSADNRILFHIDDQVIIPRQNKSNDSNNTELFIMWCISKGLKVNLSHIILTHIKHICETSQELAYGMVISVIAKHMRVEIDEYEAPQTEEVPEPSKGGKRKTVVVKGLKKSRRVSPYVRKSAQLTKGKGKSEKIVEIFYLEEEASSKSIAARENISEEVGHQKSIPLSLSVETDSEKTPSQGPSSKPDQAPSQPDPNSPKPSASDDHFAHIMFCLLSESRHSTNFHKSTLHQLEKIHTTLLATNGVLTSILHLLMKLMTEANMATASPTPAPPLRSHPQIEDIH
ncbi:uncharacterized protein G2W53_032677 [Senna tora]|uniref:Uncharacterized protein n=1 Tax=Senna tora TaxID=362788 RepID=A0A834WAE4_9FABA|nr:uncharacterized protein G2W53_032677 [Senna tora]